MRWGGNIKALVKLPNPPVLADNMLWYSTLVMIPLWRLDHARLAVIDDVGIHFPSSRLPL